ncbi:MAG TPA: heavy metal sensor histidine kinase [Burkholderiaceae bacterium]
MNEAPPFDPRRSIAWRLAAMFAFATLAVFFLIGFALHKVLEHELDRHQLEQLNTKYQMMEYMIVRSHNTEHWRHVTAKLDALSPADGTTQFWIDSPDPRYRYGKPIEGVTRLLKGPAGIGEIDLPERRYPMRTEGGDIPANDDRPAVRFMVGVDSAPYFKTKHAFQIALLALSSLGAIVVTGLGLMIARFGLQPLNKLSQEAGELSPKNLSQRLQLTRLPTELSQLGASFNGALDRLESAYQQLEGFNADVTHELRTPLANLIGQTQVALSRERPASELVETLQSNLEELERLRAIVNDMLFLARADQGERAVRLESVSLAAEVNKTVEFLDFIMDEADVSVRVEGDAKAQIETALFRRAVTNLLHNAIKHSQAKSEIVIEVSGEERHGVHGVSIAVSNPGPEIPKEHLPRLFDRFYRVDSARANSWESHGLGLSIVKAIATMHNGSVFASSQGGITVVGFSVMSAA